MKTFQLIISLSILLLCIGCSKNSKHEAETGLCSYRYQMLINFQDVSGADKLTNIPSYNPNEGTETQVYHIFNAESWSGNVQRSVYSLDRIMPKLCVDLGPDAGPFGGEPERTLTVVQFGDDYYLEFDESSSPSCPRVEIITHKFICPYIFGDNEEHIIVSRWKPLYYKDELTLQNECYSVKVDGKEVSVTLERFEWTTPNGEKVEFFISAAYIKLDNQFNPEHR